MHLRVHLTAQLRANKRKAARQKRKARTMANQGFKSTISFIIANGCQSNIQGIQWNGSAEALAETLIRTTYDMTFMGTQFSFGKNCDDTAIVIANIVIKMMQGNWEYGDLFSDDIDPDLTVSKLNQAKKVINEQR